MEINKEVILNNINSETNNLLDRELAEDKEIYLGYCEMIDSICDTSINTIASLSEKETYILRKRLGVFDGGKIQTLNVVGESLTEVLSVERIRQILKKDYRKIAGYIYRKIKEDKTRLFVEQLETTSAGTQLLDSNLSEFDLTVRTYNILRRAGITTVRDLIKLDIDDLHKIKNMGSRSLEEIINFVHENGLFFINEASTIRTYAEEIHSQLDSQQNSPLLQKYHNLLIEKTQLEGRTKELDQEISSVMEQLQQKNKEVQDGRHRK